jgi:hypothetical protein
VAKLQRKVDLTLFDTMAENEYNDCRFCETDVGKCSQLDYKQDLNYGLFNNHCPGPLVYFSIGDFILFCGVTVGTYMACHVVGESLKVVLTIITIAGAPSEIVIVEDARYLQHGVRKSIVFHIKAICIGREIISLLMSILVWAVSQPSHKNTAALIALFAFIWVFAKLTK